VKKLIMHIGLVIALMKTAIGASQKTTCLQSSAIDPRDHNSF